ncbi:MAG: NAD(P)H-hydrate dehydratase [Ruminococcus sp.]|nr:NAD(P)H-hydrate dehydratase [Ruminococcus sp.]
MKIVTTAQKREMERLADASGVPYWNLMKKAGMALGRNLEKIMDFDKQKKVVFIAGKGNNGGDCYIAADYLDSCGYDVTVALICGEPSTEISKKAFSLLSGVYCVSDATESANEIIQSDIVVDGVFGTGFKGELDESVSYFLNLNTSAIRVAVDIPSGGNGTDASVSKGCFKADHTITFGFEKCGMTQYPLKEYCGKITVADVGLPLSCCETSPEMFTVEDKYIENTLMPRKNNSHKGTYGTLLCVTGSAMMPGASLMSAMSALRSGCGMVKLCCIRENIASFAVKIPEAVFVPAEVTDKGFYSSDNENTILSHVSSCKALLMGCGIGTSEETRKLTKSLLKNATVPIILDADGINNICDNTDIIKEVKNKIILTPHPAEMARLLHCTTEEVQNDRFKACEKFISMYPGAVLVLKGAGTIIASKEKIAVSENGNPGMSCGGSGDVLSGIIASFLTQGISPYDSAVLGVAVHNKAGDIASQKYSMHSMLPTDIIECLGDVFKVYEKIG